MDTIYSTVGGYLEVPSSAAHATLPSGSASSALSAVQGCSSSHHRGNLQQLLGSFGGPAGSDAGPQSSRRASAGYPMPTNVLPPTRDPAHPAGSSLPRSSYDTFMGSGSMHNHLPPRPAQSPDTSARARASSQAKGLTSGVRLLRLSLELRANAAAAAAVPPSAAAAASCSPPATVPPQQSRREASPSRQASGSCVTALKV